LDEIESVVNVIVFLGLAYGTKVSGVVITLRKLLINIKAPNFHKLSAFAPATVQSVQTLLHSFQVIPTAA
jgi:hypothetical protein